MLENKYIEVARELDKQEMVSKQAIFKQDIAIKERVTLESKYALLEQQFQALQAGTENQGSELNNLKASNARYHLQLNKT